MSDRLLQLVLERADALEPFFDDDEVTGWEEGDLGRLLELRLIEPTAPAQSVRCNACDEGHFEKVMFADVSAAPRQRAYIRCPAYGIVNVPMTRLRRWKVDFTHLATRVRRSMNLSGTTDVIIDGRAWRLGSTTVGDKGVSVFFVRGINWFDGTEMIRALPRSACPLVLVPLVLPSMDTSDYGFPAIVALADAVNLQGEELVISGPLLATAIREADQRAQRALQIADVLDPRKSNQRIHRQVSREWKTHLETDAIIQAYNSYGSSRKAAVALRKEGRTIHHSTIARIVKEAKTMGKILRTTSSESIERGVASHRRDKPRDS